jgi:hypothetical protein
VNSPSPTVITWSSASTYLLVNVCHRSTLELGQSSARLLRFAGDVESSVMFASRDGVHVLRIGPTVAACRFRPLGTC